MIGRRGIIVLWIIGLALSGAVIVNTRFSTDMSAFLPRSPSAAERVLVDQLREGVASRLILVAIEGAAPDGLAAMSRSMADQLRVSGAFGIVNNGDPSAFERDRDLLWRNRYLLSPAVTPEHFTALRALGPSPIHRRSFAPVFAAAQLVLAVCDLPS